MGVMQEKCRVSEVNGNTVVTVRPESIAESLNGKLSPEDISNGITIMEDVTKFAALNSSLYRQCSSISKCVEHCKSPFRSIPNGNQKAKIMLLSKMPTQYEACMMCSHCDTEAALLSMILNKIHMTRHDVYCTDMIKCYCQNIDEQSVRACIENYLIKEVQYVQPEIIICNGIAVLKTWDKLGYITGLPQDVSYDNIYDVVINGMSLKITAIFDLERVLMKEGQDLNECKGKLWLQILNAYKAIGGNQ